MIPVHTDTALPTVHVTSGFNLLVHIKSRRIHELFLLYMAFQKNPLSEKQVVLSFTDLWATGDADCSEDMSLQCNR